MLSAATLLSSAPARAAERTGGGVVQTPDHA